jgi:uncharacterized Tic20 family protein
MPENSTPAPTAKANMSTSNAVLAWIFAPFTSFAFKNDPDELTRAHARESFYLGIANIAVLLVVFILQVCIGIFMGLIFYSAYGINALIQCFWSLVWLAELAFILVPRIIGAMKASQGEKWTVPYVTEFLSKYIKF